MIDIKNRTRTSTRRADREKKDELLMAIELMYFGYRAFTKEPDQILQARGLNRIHHRILYFVARKPGRSVNELLAVLDISKQALNEPLRRLVEEGLVTNERSEVDRRRRELRLTNEGAALEEELTETQKVQLLGVFEEEYEQVRSGWYRIMRSLANSA